MRAVALALLGAYVGIALVGLGFAVARRTPTVCTTVYPPASAASAVVGPSTVCEVRR